MISPLYAKYHFVYEDKLLRVHMFLQMNIE